MTETSRTLSLTAPSGLPEIRAGADLAAILVAALGSAGAQPADGDIFVVAQKVVSKSEGRTVRLDDVCPGVRALDLARRTGKDPRIAELILREADELVRVREGLIIARHRNGCVLANAGIDLSNAGAPDTAVLLPEDPDRSARKLRARIERETERTVGVIVNDSMGRAWRLGTTGTAIGASGVGSLMDRRGEDDRDGMTLQSSVIAAADEVAAAASLLMGQGKESLPFVVVRGATWLRGNGSASDLVRPLEHDLFR